MFFESWVMMNRVNCNLDVISRKTKSAVLDFLEYLKITTTFVRFLLSLNTSNFWIQPALNISKDNQSFSQKLPPSLVFPIYIESWTPLMILIGYTTRTQPTPLSPVHHRRRSKQRRLAACWIVSLDPFPRIWGLWDKGQLFGKPNETRIVLWGLLRAKYVTQSRICIQ